MFEWIAKYWLEVGFGLLSSGVVAMFAYFKKYYKKGIDATKQEEKESLVAEIKSMLDNQNLEFKNQLAQQSKDFTKQLDDQKQEFNKQLGSISARLEDLEQRFMILNNGVLSIQKRDFMADCHHLLEEDHVITLKEFEEITKEHKIYNSLGGNSDGDMYFNLIKEKYKGEISH